jgi:hypothetical protein
MSYVSPYRIVSPDGGGCATCKPLDQYDVSPSAQNAMQASARDSVGQETAFTAQSDYSLSIELLLAQLAMSFLRLN